jgi:hypothetical protein
MRRVDLAGNVFGRLTVVSYDGTTNGRVMWRCKCECGNQSSVATSNLRETAEKPVRSCGCLRREKGAMTGRSNRKHGDAVKKTTEYIAWRKIKERCYNPAHVSWKYYGMVGITMCDRWRNSFENFLSDVGRKPSPKHSIDRWPDPYGNYEPGNVRWATWVEQRHNRRGNPRLQGSCA